MNLEQKDFDNFIEPLTILKLRTEDREKMEGPLSLEDCRMALDTSESDKTPGSWKSEEVSCNAPQKN